MSETIFGATHTDLVGVARAGRAVIKTSVDGDDRDLLANNVQVSAEEALSPMQLPPEAKADTSEEQARVILVGQLGTCTVGIGSLVGSGVKDFINDGGDLEGIVERHSEGSDGALKIELYNSSVNTAGKMVSLEQNVVFTLDYWKIQQLTATGGGESPLAGFQYNIFALNASYDQESLNGSTTTTF